MDELPRITCNPRIMSGKPCIRGLRVTVDTVVGLIAAGRSHEEILREYPYLEPDDLSQALAYVARLSEHDRSPRDPIVKLLVSMNLPISWSERLRAYGFESVHWSTVGGPAAEDTEILAWAREHGFVLLIHDLGFSTVLTASSEPVPSVVQLRTPDLLSNRAVEALVAVLRTHSADLQQGALISIDETGAEVRILPLRRP